MEGFPTIRYRLIISYFNDIIPGVTSEQPKSHLEDMRGLQNVWVISGHQVLYKDNSLEETINLDELHQGSIVAIMVDDKHVLHLAVNGRDVGITTTIPLGKNGYIVKCVNVDVERRVYAVADLYGQCTQVSTNIIYHNIVFILMY